MDIEQLTERFINNKSYMKMGAGKLSKQFKCDKNDIYEAKRIVKKRKQPLLDELCEDTGIDKDDVNHYWYKGEHFSVHAVNPQMNPKSQFEAILEECKRETKAVSAHQGKILADNCAVINIYDIHLDKRNIEAPLAGSEQVDKLNAEILDGFGKLLYSVLQYNPKQFILPIGNDIFTTNGFEKATKRGTPQDPVTSHDYTFKKGLSLVRAMIDTLSKQSKVIVPIIYGNHDKDAAWYLGVALEVLYEKNENVIIQNELKARKYFQYGDNLFGFGHGDTEKKMIDKLPLIMATENPKLWGDTIYRKFYLGDQHHKMEYKFFRTKDHPGCEIQFLRSAGISDAWHEDNGFIGVPRSIESTVYHLNKGQVANYNINI